MFHSLCLQIRSSYGHLTVTLFTLYLVPLKAYLSSPKGLPKSPQPTFMAILSLCLALWASGPQDRPYRSISSQLEEELGCIKSICVKKFNCRNTRRERPLGSPFRLVFRTIFYVVFQISWQILLYLFC